MCNGACCATCWLLLHIVIIVTLAWGCSLCAPIRMPLLAHVEPVGPVSHMPQPPG